MSRINIIITGAGGFIGSLLAARLLEDPRYHLTLTDVFEPTVPPAAKHKDHATTVKGDLADPAFVQSLVASAQPLGAVFVMHGIMSSGSEADYDLSLRVNVESVRTLCEHLRRANPGLRVVYASSQAVFGQPLPAVVSDNTRPTPESTYGAHKLLCETYLSDLHRKGFLDVFCLRFPTVVVRPGRPSTAASSFLSGMIREPMKGEECVIPLQDRAFRSFICSPSSLAENLVRILHMPADRLPPHIRSVNMPGISVSTQELMDGLAKHGGADKLQLLHEETDPAQERILRSWATDMDVSTPRRLGLVIDERAEDIVREYIEGLK